MGSMSIWHWIVVGAVLLLLFGGKGKVSDIMGDFAKGIKSFKKGMSEDDTVEVPRATTEPLRPADPLRAADPLRTIDHRTATVETPVDSRRVG